MEILFLVLIGLIGWSALRGWMRGSQTKLLAENEVARGAGKWRLGDTVYHLTGKVIAGEWTLVYVEGSPRHNYHNAFGVACSGQKLSSEFVTPKASAIVESYVEAAVGTWKYKDQIVTLQRVTLEDGTSWIAAVDQQGQKYSPMEITVQGRQTA
jgi:hypothetical protein